MRDYIKIENVDKDKINSYLLDGWEIIETSKSAFPEGETQINYHVGMPAITMMEKYKSIIDDYEKFGFKEALFQKVAESHNTVKENYDTTGWGRKDEVSRYFTYYEKTVHEGAITYHVKNTNELDTSWF